MEQSERKKTRAGMMCYFLPQKGFAEQMAAVVVQCGANHLYWKEKDGRRTAFPPGTAHFLEHKLFQKKWGDALATFAQKGATANAFTDGDKTVYYVTCKEDFLEHLRLLLELVQEPYFTETATEREKEIISREIRLYQDDPDRMAYEQLLKSLYGKHPVQYPIAGREEDLSEITARTLRDAYTHLVTTDRMALICAGDIPLRRTWELADGMERQETEARVYFPMEESGILEKYTERKMGLSRPRFQIGCKLLPIQQQEWLQGKSAAWAAMELWAGESSGFYERAYTKGILEEPLGGALLCGEGYAFAAFSGSAEQPEEIAELLCSSLEKLQREGVKEEDFLRIRKKVLGQFLRRTGTPKGKAFAQMEWAGAEVTLEEVMQRLKGLQKKEVEQMLKEAFSVDRIALSVIT